MRCADAEALRRAWLSSVRLLCGKPLGLESLAAALFDIFFVKFCLSRSLSSSPRWCHANAPISSAYRSVARKVSAEMEMHVVTSASGMRSTEAEIRRGKRRRETRVEASDKEEVTRMVVEAIKRAYSRNR